MDSKGVIVVPNKEKQDHKTPNQNAHGLCLAQPSVVFLWGGTGASKTTYCISTFRSRNTAPNGISRTSS